MNRTAISFCVLLGCFAVPAGCDKVCHGSGEIIEFLNSAQIGIDQFELVKVDLDGRSTSLTSIEDISEFSRNLFNSFNNYLDTTPPAERHWKRTWVGEITVKKRGEPESSYELHRSTEVPDLYFFRIHDSSKGGGTLFSFRGFSVSGNPVF